MILVDLAGLIVGGVLAQHFRVLVLVPSSLVVGGGTAIVALTGAQQETRVLLEALSIVGALQTGYFFGLFTKRLAAGLHKPQMNTA